MAEGHLPSWRISNIIINIIIIIIITIIIIIVIIIIIMKQLAFGVLIHITDKRTSKADTVKTL